MPDFPTPKGKDLEMLARQADVAFNPLAKLLDWVYGTNAALGNLAGRVRDLEEKFEELEGNERRKAIKSELMNG